MSSSLPVQHVQLVVLDRIDPARNMARYYVLSIEPTLFDDSSLVREWGRIGKPGRRSDRASPRRGQRPHSAQRLVGAESPTRLQNSASGRCCLALVPQTDADNAG